MGVPPEEIRLRLSKTPGALTCIGPRPKATKNIPDLPKVQNYCFTFVLGTPPPRDLCDAYEIEYAQLKAELAELIEAEAWDDATAVLQRLSELERLIDNICRTRGRAITYCVFPDEWFEDPFVGGRMLPSKPPTPY